MIAALLAAAALDASPAPAPSDVYAIDPHAGVWLRGPSLPSPRQDSSVAEVGGRIFVIGGFGPGAQPTATTFVLEPAPGTDLNPSPNGPAPPTVPLGTWTTARSIPEAIDHGAAAVLDGYIYVAGGTVEKLVTNKFWRYDPSDDSWASMPPLPVPRYAATMQAVDGKLYLFGGAASHGHDERSIEVYDPGARSWSLIDDALPSEREESETASFMGRIALVGGRDREERNLTSCDLYDAVRNGWAVCSNMHSGRSDFGLAAVDDRLFAIGGVNIMTGLTTQTIEISGPGGRGWMDGHWLPAPRKGMGIAVIGHTVWVIGGSNSDAVAPISSVLRYVVPLVKVKFGGRAPQ